MRIMFNKYHSGREVVKALSSILKYKAKVLVETEVFDEELGIVSETVSVQLTSLSPSKYIGNSNIYYNTVIIIDNIILTCKYYLINMKINYIRSDGTVFSVEVLNDSNGNKTDLTKNIETVIRQFLKNLNINKV